MGRAIPLPPLQGHEACNRVNFTFYLSLVDVVFSGRCLCDGLITRPDDPIDFVCLFVCLCVCVCVCCIECGKVQQ
jgi:hypothetical protein